MKQGVGWILRAAALAICGLTFVSNAQAQDIFSDYARADFDAVREDLTVANFENLDRSGQDSYLNIAYHVYADRPEFPLSELADLYGELASVLTSDYTRKRLSGLIAAMADAALLDDHRTGKALVRVNSLASELAQIKGLIMKMAILLVITDVGIAAISWFGTQHGQAS